MEHDTKCTTEWIRDTWICNKICCVAMLRPYSSQFVRNSARKPFLRGRHNGRDELLLLFFHGFADHKLTIWKAVSLRSEKNRAFRGYIFLRDNELRNDEMDFYTMVFLRPAYSQIFHTEKNRATRSHVVSSFKQFRFELRGIDLARISSVAWASKPARRRFKEFLRREMQLMQRGNGDFARIHGFSRGRGGNFRANPP